MVNHRWRDRVAARIDEWTWQGIYSLISTAALVLIIIGYGEARPVSGLLYTPPIWSSHLVLLTLLPVFILLFATYLPGRIQTFIKNLMLVATVLWTTSHLLANGRVVKVTLFGSMLLWAVLIIISMTSRVPRSIPNLPKTAFNDIIAVSAGLGIYAAFVLELHQDFFGVALIG
jgi:uncharacterized membrane protein